MYWDNLLGGFILVVYSYSKFARIVFAVERKCQAAGDAFIDLII
jgi:hypothetical protein